MAKVDKKNSPYSELARKLKGSDYSNAINTIQIDLGLLKTNGAEMEALLIYIVNRRYRQRGRNADITLMALGLLDGYHNRVDRLEPSEERDLYAERRETFLQKTNYIAINYGDQAKTYKEAEQTLVKNPKTGTEFPLIERIRNTLNKSTTNCLIDVLATLYEDKGITDEHLQKAKEDFQKRAHEKEIKRINWPELDHIPPELLPPLKHYIQSAATFSASEPELMPKADPEHNVEIRHPDTSVPATDDFQTGAKPTIDSGVLNIDDLPALVSDTQELPPNASKPKKFIEKLKAWIRDTFKIDKFCNPTIITVIMALAILALAMLVFAIYTNYTENANLDIDPVEAHEGGGIVNPDEASIEPDVSMRYQSFSGATFDIDIFEPNRTASVSIEITDSDGRTEKVIIELDELYNGAETGRPGVANKDFSGGVDAYEGDT